MSPISKLRSGTRRDPYFAIDLGDVMNSWTSWHLWYLENASWSETIDPDCLQSLRGATRNAGVARRLARAIALFQNRSRAVYHRCSHPSSSMQPPVISRRNKGGVAARPRWRPALWRQQRLKPLIFWATTQHLIDCWLTPGTPKLYQKMLVFRKYEEKVGIARRVGAA